MKNKSKPVLGLVRPNNNFEAPTAKLSKSNASKDKLIGRQDLNLRLIRMAVISKIAEVIPRNPKSSIRITMVGVFPGVTNKISLS